MHKISTASVGFKPQNIHSWSFFIRKKRFHSARNYNKRILRSELIRKRFPSKLKLLVFGTAYSQTLLEDSVSLLRFLFIIKCTNSKIAGTVNLENKLMNIYLHQLYLHQHYFMVKKILTLVTPPFPYCIARENLFLHLFRVIHTITSSNNYLPINC